jgi:uncharacterized repeat protein (TIGR02543 family)
MRKPHRAIVRKDTWKRRVSLGLAAALLLAFNAAAAENPENTCEHGHSDACYAAPEEHVCAVETGCEPIYPDVVTPGHNHNDDCWIPDPKTGDPVLICALEQGPDITAPDTAAEPIGWTCGALEFVCAHADCVLGADCVALAPLGGPVAFGMYGLEPLAVFDGASLTGPGNEMSYGHEAFVSEARLLTVNAEFETLSSDRTIEIILVPGLRFEVLPGFTWSDSTRTWTFVGASLPSELQTAVTGAVWTPDALSASEAKNIPGGVNLRSGTVAYTVANSVSEIVITATVKYDMEFLLNTQDAPAVKTLSNALTVTTSADSEVIETQRLETLNINGQGGIYLLQYTSVLSVEQGQTGVELGGWRLDLSATGFVSSDQRQGTNYYLPHAEFTLHVPAGFTLNPTNPIGFNAGGLFDHPGVLVTEVTGDHTTGTFVKVILDSIFATTTQDRSFWLKLSVDGTTPLGDYPVTFEDLSVTPYDGIAGSEGNVVPTVFLRVTTDTGLATITVAPYNSNGVGYVPGSQIALGEGTMLALYTLRNNNPHPLPLQTVRIDFTNAPGEVMPRQVTIPVGTDNKAPHVRVHTTGGQTIDVVDLTTGFSATNQDVAEVVFSLKDHVATGYIDWVEYEIENIEPTYGMRAGAYYYSAYMSTAVYGAFAETKPASVNYTVKLKTGSIAAIAGDWSAPDKPTVTISTPVKNPAAAFYITGISSGTYMAGASYSPNVSINLPSTSMRADNTVFPAGTGLATYVKGIDIYLRTMGSLTIDPATIRVAPITSDHNLTNNDPWAYVSVPTGDITVLQDNQGFTVYKIHLPDAVLSYQGSGSEKTGGVSRRIYLNYSFTVKKDAMSETHLLSNLIWVNTLYGEVARGSDNYRQNGNLNTYNVAGDGVTNVYYGTLSNAQNFLIQAQSAFMATTAAQLEVGGSLSGWQTADSVADALRLTPFGTIEYRFRAQNNSGKAAGNYTVHIPIPKVGEGAASGFKGDASATPPADEAEFQWTAALSGPVVVPGGVSATVSYSTVYKANTNDDTGFEAWDSGHAENYRTVRIVHNTSMPDGSVHDYVLPLEVDGDAPQKLIWTNAGAYNFYSSYVSYQIQGSVAVENQPSQPVAILLSSGIVVGRVYQDNDRDGTFTAGDEGLANVQVVPTVTAGPTFVANGNANKLLDAVFTDSEGYYQVVLANTDVVSLVVSNPAFGTKMLRFYGAASVAQTKTLTGIIANTNAAALQGGAEGLVPPYTIQWNDNRAPYGLGANTTFAAIYRYGNEPVVGVHETTDTLPTVPPTASAVSGYDYSKWYSNTSGFSGFEPGAWPANADAAFYALRVGKAVTVSFLNNYADDDDTHYAAAETANTGKKFAETLSNSFTAPTRTGYDFDGWYTARTAGTQWNFGTGTIQAEGTTILYAQWTVEGTHIPTYTLSFSLGGSAQYPTTPASIPSVSLYAGDFISAAAGYGTPSRAGYGFVGWYMNGAMSVPVTAGSVMPASNQTIYAKWTQGYAVTFNGNGGMVILGNETRTVALLATTLGTLPPDPTWNGYTFTGWNTKADGTGAGFTGATPVTGDITVYAQWYYTDGGEPTLPETTPGTDPSVSPSVTSPPITDTTPAPGSTQPTPQPGNHLQPGDNAWEYIEVDAYGVALGVWRYGEETGEWVYFKYTSLSGGSADSGGTSGTGASPATGDEGLPFYWPLLLFLSLLGIGATLWQWKRRR